MADDGGDNIFLYTGGEQEVPRGVTHVRIDRSVKTIPYRAFDNRRSVVSVEFHVGVEKIEKWAFAVCVSLERLEMLGVMEVDEQAFWNCYSLSEVRFGDKLETIGEHAFHCCHLGSVTIPSARTIGYGAFGDCQQLTDVEFGDKLETIRRYAFAGCFRLRRIAIPLKDDMFPLDDRECTQFDRCENLTTVDLVGIERIHKTIASLLLESWKDEMNQEIDRINRVLPNTPAHSKTEAIMLWIRSVINRMEHYKAEHLTLLKEAMALLELALWKANLDANVVSYQDGVRVTRGRIKRARKEKCITSGADIIIKNVLPFLRLNQESKEGKT